MGLCGIGKFWDIEDKMGQGRQDGIIWDREDLGQGRQDGINYEIKSSNLIITSNYHHLQDFSVKQQRKTSFGEVFYTDMKFVQLIQVSTMDKIEEQIKNSKYSATFSMIAMLFKKPC